MVLARIVPTSSMEEEPFAIATMMFSLAGEDVVAAFMCSKTTENLDCQIS